MLSALRGEGDEVSEEKLAELLDGLVQRLIQDGFLTTDQVGAVPAGHQPVTGKGSIAQAAAKDVQFNLTDKGTDFLGFKTLRHLMGSFGKSSIGSHDTPQLSTGIESRWPTRSPATAISTSPSISTMATSWCGSRSIARAVPPY